MYTQHLPANYIFVDTANGQSISPCIFEATVNLCHLSDITQFYLVIACSLDASRIYLFQLWSRTVIFHFPFPCSHESSIVSSMRWSNFNQLEYLKLEFESMQRIPLPCSIFHYLALSSTILLSLPFLLYLPLPCSIFHCLALSSTTLLYLSLPSPALTIISIMSFLHYFIETISRYLPFILFQRMFLFFLFYLFLGELECRICDAKFQTSINNLTGTKKTIIWNN